MSIPVNCITDCAGSLESIGSPYWMPQVGVHRVKATCYYTATPKYYRSETTLVRSSIGESYRMDLEIWVKSRLINAPLLTQGPGFVLWPIGVSVS